MQRALDKRRRNVFVGYSAAFFFFYIEIFKNFYEDCADFSSEKIEKQRNTPKKYLDLQKWSKVIIVNHRAWNEKAHAGIA